MDLRILHYFLAVAREENITRAAEELHIAQPTLSKQLMELEDELGKKLLIRGKRKITLTEEGSLLRKRAEEIITLLEKTKSEIASDAQKISGEISIGGKPPRTILKAAANLRNSYSGIQFHFFYGDALAVVERLDHGSLDFAVLLLPINTNKYESLLLPDTSYWGLLMGKDSPLAALPTITKNTLRTVPLVFHQRPGIRNRVALWAETDLSQLDIAATYNVAYGNPTAFIQSGLGYFLTARDSLADELDSTCCFRPLDPPIQLQYALVWKKNAMLSKASEAFLEKVKELSRFPFPQVLS